MAAKWWKKVSVQAAAVSAVGAIVVAMILE